MPAGSCFVHRNILYVMMSFGRLPDTIPREDAVYNMSRLALLIRSLSMGSWYEIINPIGIILLREREGEHP